MSAIFAIYFMKSSKLILLLKSFSRKEMKALNAFLNSPYHNSNQELLRFFEALRPYYPTFRKLEGGKEKLFSMLYPSDEYNDKRLRYLMSDLFRLTQEFLLVESDRKKTLERSLRLLQEFTERGLEKHYGSLSQQLELELNSHPIRSVEHFHQRLLYAEEYERHSTQQRARVMNDNPQQASDDLNRYYALKKLKYACNMLNRQAVVKAEYELDLPGNWKDWMEANNYWNEEIIRAYGYVFEVLTNSGDSTAFEKLQNWLLENKEGFALRDLKELHLYAINFCARKIREGKDQYTNNALQLYLNGIQGGALLEDGYFSPWSFGNVVKLALRLERFDWIEQFMNDHQSYLPKEFRENTMLYNLAELYCYKKDFGKALHLLIQVEFSDLSYHLGSRIMLSKIYYELGEEEALLSLMGSFSKFLKRHKKVSEGIRETCLNFCDILQYIVRGKTDGLEERIKTVSLLTDREWLLEKLGAL